jgi:hypothetical protein
MTDNQLIQLEDEAWSLYCRLGSAFENDIFSTSAARMGKTCSISDQTLSPLQARLAAACRRAYARYQRRSDALM